MIFITGPLYSGKRTFAQRLPGTRIAEVQALAAEAEDLEKLAEELSAYDIVMATEVGGGVVPMDAGERAAREAAGRLACLLAARAGCVVDCHVKIDTGMSRLGFDAESDGTVPLVETLAQSGSLHITGIFTHFAVADEDNALCGCATACRPMAWRWGCGTAAIPPGRCCTPITTWICAGWGFRSTGWTPTPA